MVKMGRTQLQDAVPIRLGQEFARLCVGRCAGNTTGWHAARKEMLQLNLGGTAVGTGINADARLCRTGGAAAFRDDRASPLPRAVT